MLIDCEGLSGPELLTVLQCLPTPMEVERAGETFTATAVLDATATTVTFSIEGAPLQVERHDIICIKKGQS